MSRLPSLNWLRVFEAAARTESFARAAAELGLSAPAVSQQIKALETQLGTALFERQAHSVRLTDVGRAYLPSVRDALAGLEQATDGLFGQTPQHSVYVQAVLVFAQGILAPAYPLFQADLPDTGLVLTTGNQPADFDNSFNDLRIVFGDAMAQFGPAVRIMDDVLVPVCTPSLAKQLRDPLDLQEQTLIEVATHQFGWSQILDHLGLRSGGFKFLYADSTTMAFAFAQAGAGVALARRPVTQSLEVLHGLVPCFPEIAVNSGQGYHLITTDGRSLRRPARRYKDWLIDLTRSLSAETEAT